MCVCWQVCHVEDAAFSQALDSFAPGYADVKSLARACLAFRDFPPMGTEQNLREALGSVAVNYVLIERDERGCGTGLCYAQVSRPSVAFRSAAENRSVPLGIARRRFSPPPPFFCSCLVWFLFLCFPPQVSLFFCVFRALAQLVRRPFRNATHQPPSAIDVVIESFHLETIDWPQKGTRF